MKWGWLLLGLLVLSACQGQDYSCPDCNVILISIDTFRGDHLDCAGYAAYDADITKNICDFASESVLFTRAIAQAPSTLPSHASMLTSLIPSQHQALYGARQALPDSRLSLAEVLKKEGYETAAFTGVGQMDAEWGLDQGFDVYDDYLNETFEERAGKGLNWVDKSNGRFFLFLHTFEIHHPYTPKKEYAAMLSDYQGGLGTNISISLLKSINAGDKTIDSKDLEHIIAMYDAEIISVDSGFRFLIEQLKQKGLYNKTIIIFTSDHGEEFDEHGKVGWHSHTLYNELLHVPLIIHAPGLAPSQETGLACSIDIAPTVLQMLDIKVPGEFMGRSLFSSHKEFCISERDTSASELPFAVQTKAWKYYKEGSSEYLFNLVEDSAEKASQDNTGIRTKLLRLYTGWFKNGKIESSTKQINLSEQKKDELKNLGYIV